jgi:hypothetical protein
MKSFLKWLMNGAQKGEGNNQRQHELGKGL